MAPCQIPRATENSAIRHPILTKSLVRVQYYVAKFYMAYCMILNAYLVQAQDHAAKFLSTHCTIAHATESLATKMPRSIVEMLRLLLETLLRVLRMMAIKSQKFILYTSDLTSTKVISNGEPTASYSLVTHFPSISVFSAYKLQWILHKSADMDNLCITKADAYEPGTIARRNGSREFVPMDIKAKTQKLILYTSDVAHAKVTITGEPITPSLLITAPPSIGDLSAGITCAHNLLRAQLVTLQHLLHAPVDLDNLRIGNSDVYECDIRPMAPCPSITKYYALCIVPTMPYLTIITRSLLAH